MQGKNIAKSHADENYSQTCGPAQSFESKTYLWIDAVEL